MYVSPAPTITVEAARAEFLRAASLAVLTHRPADWQLVAETRRIWISARRAAGEYVAA